MVVVLALLEFGEEGGVDSECGGVGEGEFTECDLRSEFWQCVRKHKDPLRPVHRFPRPRGDRPWTSVATVP